MAGIGFGLKKIFNERGVFNVLKGSLYSAFAVLGPMLIIIVSFIVLLVVTDYQGLDYLQKDLFTSIMLYAFVFSLLLTSPLSAIVSRYIADRIFEERTEDVMPCYYMGLLINTVLGADCCVPFIIMTITRGKADPLLMLISGSMFMALLFVFYNMTFISALREYKSIALAFLSGMGAAVGLALLLIKGFGMPFILSALSGMAAGFLIIAIVLFSLIHRFFGTNSRRYGDFLSYFGKYGLLFFTNFFYMAGLYAHNFVYWFASPLSVTVMGTFRSAPVYDTSTFLAMLTSVTATVIFTVRVEINFHERYHAYCRQVLGGIGSGIIAAKQNMFSTLVKELLFIAELQAALSIITFLVIRSFASLLGFGGLVMSIYPALAAGYFVIYIMYCVIVFLFYFDDRAGAFWASLTFFIVTLAVTLAARNLSTAFYGIGPFAGGFAGWTVAFLRLKHCESTLDRRVFCKGQLVPRVYVKAKNYTKPS